MGEEVRRDSRDPTELAGGQVRQPQSVDDPQAMRISEGLVEPRASVDVHDTDIIPQ